MRLRDMPVWQHIAKKVWRDAAAADPSFAADRLSRHQGMLIAIPLNEFRPCVAIPLMTSLLCG